MEVPPRDARMWAMWCHLGALSGFIGIPFGNVLVPAVIWLTKRNDHPFIDENGKESLNFHVSLIFYFVIAVVLCLVFVGFVLLPVLYIGGIIFTITAAIRASDGAPYRYPMTIRLFN
jgi:hypothetical protein